MVIKATPYSQPIRVSMHITFSLNKAIKARKANMFDILVKCSYNKVIYYFKTLTVDEINAIYAAGHHLRCTNRDYIKVVTHFKRQEKRTHRFSNKTVIITAPLTTLTPAQVKAINPISLYEIEAYFGKRMDLFWHFGNVIKATQSANGLDATVQIDLSAYQQTTSLFKNLA
jgi:hypothetical protein